MAQYRINAGVVREEFFDILSDMDYWAFEENEAEKQLTYIAGAYDMARSIIKRYEDGDSK